MDHREFLTSLTAAQRQRLTQKSDARGLLHLATHLLALVVTGGMIIFSVPAWPLVLLVHGVLLVFLFTLLHETTHRTPFRSRRLNSVVGYLCGLVLFLPPGWFRHFHFAHHRFTQDPTRDPELAEAKPTSWRGYLWTLTGMPVWHSHLKTLVRNARGACNDEFVAAPALAAVQREAVSMLLVYLSLLLVCTIAGAKAWHALLMLWLVPAALGQPFLRLYLMAEHGRCAHVSNRFANTRTTFTHRVVRWLAWNMPYHAEHHANPAVPFYRLPELHKLASSHLRETENGYARFHRRYVQQVIEPGATD